MAQAQWHAEDPAFHERHQLMPLSFKVVHDQAFAILQILQYPGNRKLAYNFFAMIGSCRRYCSCGMVLS